MLVTSYNPPPTRPVAPTLVIVSSPLDSTPFGASHLRHEATSSPSTSTTTDNAYVLTIDSTSSPEAASTPAPLDQMPIDQPASWVAEISTIADSVPVEVRQGRADRLQAALDRERLHTVAAGFTARQATVSGVAATSEVQLVTAVTILSD